METIEGIIYLTKEREIKAFHSINPQITMTVFTSLDPELVIYVNGTENLDILTEDELKLYKLVKKTLTKSWNKRIETMNLPQEQIDSLEVTVNEDTDED